MVTVNRENRNGDIDIGILIVDVVERSTTNVSQHSYRYL